MLSAALHSGPFESLAAIPGEIKDLIGVTIRTPTRSTR